MAENRIKEIPVVQLHNRYKIHMDQGYIYTRKGGSIMPTYERDGDTYVKLIPEGCSDEVEFSVTELVMNTIYGYTGLMPSVNVIGLPFNTYSIYPIPRPIQEVTPRDRLTDIIIGDLLYKRWNGSKYFVNKYGAIFSEPYGAFVKQNFNDRDYRLVSIGKKSVRVHRIVWEAWNERVIPDSREIDHIDGLRWHNDLDNLRAVTHAENISFIDTDVYGRNIPLETRKLIIRIAKEVIQNKRTIEQVAKMFKIPEELVTDVALSNKYDKMLKRYGVDVNNMPRNKAYSSLTPEKIRSIRDAKNRGMSNASIMKEYGITSNVLGDIIYQNGQNNLPMDLAMANILTIHDTLRFNDYRKGIL